MEKDIRLTAEVPEDMAGVRVDKVMAQLFPDYSRSQLKTWLADGSATLNGARVKPKEKVLGSETIDINAVLAERENWEAQAMDLDIIYEDEAILVINKPVGLVAHPAAGNLENTLVNALLHHHADLSCLPRGGLVHRIDKETSGLLVVAKTLTAHKHLVEQLQSREMGREYVALVHGELTGGGKVDEPIGRHPTVRIKQAVVPDGKSAVTHFRLAERFAEHTLINLKLETGRTHQIRVHMAHIKHPLVGDPLYGRRFSIPKKASNELIAALQQFKHQALHAKTLTLVHPVSGETVSFEAAIPQDFQSLTALLREHKASLAP